MTPSYATDDSCLLILASRSPRRRELLAALGVAFDVHTADIDESQRPGETAESLVQRLAREKGSAVAAQRPVYILPEIALQIYGSMPGKGDSILPSRVPTSPVKAPC